LTHPPIRKKTGIQLLIWLLLELNKKKEAWLKNLDYHKSLSMPFEEYGRRGREPDDIVYNQSGN